MQVFRDFPYCYDGDVAYEREYLATYVNAPRSLAFLVYDGDITAGYRWRDIGAETDSEKRMTFWTQPL